jgi:hypothetical protein
MAMCDKLSVFGAKAASLRIASQLSTPQGATPCKVEGASARVARGKYRLDQMTSTSRQIADGRWDPGFSTLPFNECRWTAPVSHQKRRQPIATNASEIKRKRSKINEADRYSAAHHGLVAGLSPAGHQPSRFALRLESHSQVSCSEVSKDYRAEALAKVGRVPRASSGRANGKRQPQSCVCSDRHDRPEHPSSNRFSRPRLARRSPHDPHQEIA